MIQRRQISSRNARRILGTNTLPHAFTSYPVNEGLECGGYTQYTQYSAPPKMQTGLAPPPLSNLSELVLSYSYHRSDREVFSLCPHRPKPSRQYHRRASWVRPPNSPGGTRVIHGRQGRVVVYRRLELFPEPSPRFHISSKGFKFYWGQLH